MFFAALVALPVLAGLVAGVTTHRRSVPWALTAVCVLLGVAGAIVMGLDSETTSRPGAIGFGLVSGLAAAGLVWLGFGLGRLTRASEKAASA